MNTNEYEYEYHDLAEGADYLDETNDECYYDDGSDEPWMAEPDDVEAEDTYTDYMTDFQNCYQDIDEIDD